MSRGAALTVFVVSGLIAGPASHAADQTLPRLVPPDCPIGQVTEPGDACSASDGRLADGGVTFVIDRMGDARFIENSLVVARHDLGGPAVLRPSDDIPTGATSK